MMLGFTTRLLGMFGSAGDVPVDSGHSGTRDYVHRTRASEGNLGVAAPGPYGHRSIAGDHA